MRKVYLAVLAIPFLLGAAGGIVRIDDFGCYWCGAKINWAGGNPYDRAEVLALERTIEPERDKPVMPYAPPWALAVVTPLIGLDYALARWLWLLAEAAAFVLASALLWQVYHGPAEYRLVSWILCFTFYPTIIMLALGQVSFFNLLALAGFLFFLDRNADFRAGLAAALIAPKPHVMLLFALAVLVWIAIGRRWRVLAGGMLGMALLTAPVLLPNPRVFSQYAAMMSQRDGPADLIPPTPASPLRYLAGGAFWPSLIPLSLGLAWLAQRLITRGRVWNWSRATPALTFACFLSAPYAWAYDLVIVLAPITLTAINVQTDPGRRLRFFTCHLLITLGTLILNVHDRPEYEYIWLAPALLGLYLAFYKPGHDLQVTRTGGTP